MWKFQDFSTTQIIREINFRDSRKAKSATFWDIGGSEFWIFELHEFVPFLKAEIYQISNFLSLKMAKVAVLEHLESTELFHLKSKWQKNPELSTLWKLRNSTATSFSQKFRQMTISLRNFAISWFDVKKLHGSEFLYIPHCADI